MKGTFWIVFISVPNGLVCSVKGVPLERVDGTLLIDTFGSYSVTIS